MEGHGGAKSNENHPGQKRTGLEVLTLLGMDALLLADPATLPLSARESFVLFPLWW